MIKKEFKEAYGTEFEIITYEGEVAQEEYIKIANDQYVGEKHKLVTLTSSGQVLVKGGRISREFDRYSDSKLVLGIYKDKTGKLVRLVVVTAKNANEKECLNIISGHKVSDVNIFDAVVEDAVLEVEETESIEEVTEEVVEKEEAEEDKKVRKTRKNKEEK